MHLGGLETVHGEAMYWPDRRGPAHFDELRIWSTFPFGIIRKSLARSQPQHTLVYPRLYPLRRRVLEAVAPAGAIGSRISPHAGAGDDYFGLREYRPGDPLRHIAWKRTANRDELVCIERTRPNPPKLRVVLNLTKPPRAPAESEEDDLEEQAISLAASIVHSADLAGYEIGLTVLGVDRAPIPIRRSHWHRNRIMAALAEIDLEEPRVPTGPWAPAHQELAGLVVVHPDRVEPGVIRDDAWHFSARQMDHLVDRTGAHRPGRGADAEPEVSAETAHALESEAAA
jgi:uncharacterized protein (DUF58 family)